MKLEGTITEIRADTFWGVFDDGATFDMPIGILGEHQVGDTVIVNEADDGDDHDVSFIIVNDTFATVAPCRITEEGCEIIDNTVFRYNKADLEAKDATIP